MSMTIFYQDHLNPQENLVIKDGVLISKTETRKNIVEEMMSIIKNGKLIAEKVWTIDDIILFQMFSIDRDEHGRNMPIIIEFNRKMIEDKSLSKVMAEIYEQLTIYNISLNYETILAVELKITDALRLSSQNVFMLVFIRIVEFFRRFIKTISFWRK